MLEARGLTHAYEGTQALAALSLTIEPGQIVGLLGPNGAGKSTAISIIAGRLRPDGGTVRLLGRSLDGLAAHHRVRLGLGYLPQEPSVFRDCTVRENLQLAVDSLGGSVEDLEYQLEARGLSKLDGHRARTLSGGERRRLELARCLLGAPKVLILDEPFAGVDPVGIEELQETFRDLAATGIGFLITDHAVQATLGVCHSAVILDGGTVMAEGCPESVAADAVVRARYLGHGFEYKKLQ